MIRGQVSHRRALVPVTFRLSGQPDLVIEFVVDTGFAGFLTLPLAAVLVMGLPYQHHTPAGLADDSQVQIPVYEAIIVWEGIKRAVRVLAMGKRLYSVTLHLRLVHDKIHIEQDWTDDFLADLISAGVPRKDLVLAFTPPEMRAMTEFVVA